MKSMVVAVPSSMSVSTMERRSSVRTVQQSPTQPV
jgi:hypothetical protein